MLSKYSFLVVVILLLTCIVITPAQQQSQTFNYTGTIQTFTVPAGVTTLRLEANGAQGASAQSGRSGGKGAKMTGDFVVAPGDQFLILVGRAGSAAIGSNGGGGGGTFVVKVDPAAPDIITTGAFAGVRVSPLIIAGGGGGTRDQISVDGFPGVTANRGTTGSCSNENGSGGGQNNNSSLGNGGSAPCVSWGSAGGGFRTNGANDSTYGTGGASFLNGGAGGSGSCGSCSGGFGGGGSGQGGYGGGGGGGYTGGDGGRVAGGGGSYNIGTNQDNVSGFQSGNGKVVITYNANNAPVANSQAASTTEDMAVSVILSATDVDNNPLNYSITSQPSNGVVI